MLDLFWVALIVFLFFYLLNCRLFLVMSSCLRLVASLSIMQIAQCTGSELVWRYPIAGDFKMFTGSFIQTGMQQEQGPLLVAGGVGGVGGDWNETREAKSPNLGPGFLAGIRVWNLQNFLCWLCSCFWACTTVMSDSSSERRLEGWMEGVEEVRRDVLPAFVQNTEMQIRRQNW